MNSQYYNSRRRRDAWLYLHGTEADAVDQGAVRRLRDTRSSSPDDVCSDFYIDILHAYFRVPGTVCARGDLWFSLCDNSLPSWNHHNHQHNIQWNFSNCHCRSCGRLTIPRIYVYHLPSVGFLLVFFSLNWHCNMVSYSKGGQRSFPNVL